MNHPEDSAWTHLKDAEGNPICCRCREHVEPRWQIRWQAKPHLGNVVCYTCFECFTSMTDDQRLAHRSHWRAVE